MSIEILSYSRYKIVCGRWLVDGNPQVILFDVGSAAHKMNEFKQELFDAAGIGAPHGDLEVNDVIIFGFMVAQFIADFRVKAESYHDVPPRVSAHFHEWMAGIGLVMTRLWKTEVATLFTTHATQLGRLATTEIIKYVYEIKKF